MTNVDPHFESHEKYRKKEYIENRNETNNNKNNSYIFLKKQCMKTNFAKVKSRNIPKLLALCLLEPTKFGATRTLTSRVVSGITEQRTWQTVAAN